MQACRQRLGLTCEEVARIATISREYYIKIENGQNTPSRTTMMQIAEALQVDCKKDITAWAKLYELQAVEDKED
jgi:DNA-binding XRE family transcriptional regulator